MSKCSCYFCSQDEPHRSTHKMWWIISPEKEVAMVACRTCGHVEKYDQDVHVDVQDIG